MAAVLDKYDKLREFLLYQEGIPVEQSVRIVNYMRTLDAPTQGGGRRHTYAKKVPGRVTRSNRSRRRY
jgi:hypothetical protein